MTTLQIAEDVELPADAITQSFAILAKRGAGKTYTATVMAEEFVAAGLPFVVLDPTGAWWGLRAAADGVAAGLPVVILGGSHGDLPLEPTAGKLVAELVVEQPGWYILDLSLTKSNAEQDRFVADFAEALYRLKATKPAALHLFVDEADSFAPQRAMPGQQRMLGAMEAIVRRGRIRGLGVTLITQRAAVLNKNVLTQTETLVILQTTSPQDRAAIDAWVEGNASRDERAEVMGSLASLERGEAWVWSPSWMRMLKRARIRRRHTFDSSATPEAGAQAVAPTLTAVDLEQLRDRLAAVTEKVKSDDPAALKKRVKQLEAQVVELLDSAAQERGGDAAERNALKQDREALDRERAAVERERESQAQLLADVAWLEGRLAEATESLKSVVGLMDSVGTFTARRRERRAAGVLPERQQPSTKPARAPRPPITLPAPATSSGSESLGRAERAILSVLAQFPQGRSRLQLGMLAGYSVKSSGFANSLGKLRRDGLISPAAANPITATEAGIAAIGDAVIPLAPGQDVLAHWMSRLGKAERIILQVLVDAYPESVEKQELAERTGYSATSSGFANALGKLRGLELVRGFAASDELMEGING